MTRMQPEQWNLKRLTDELARQKPDADVRFDFAYLHPTGLISYRGYYDQLAFTFDEESDYPTVETVLNWLRDANGKAFEGYKGGHFKMHNLTPLWVANYGNSGGTAVVGVDVRGDGADVYLQTALLDL